MPPGFSPGGPDFPTRSRRSVISPLAQFVPRMPDIRFDCPTCNQSLEAPEELANQLIDCPTCKATIEIPARSRPLLPEIVPPPALPPAVVPRPSAPAPARSPSLSGTCFYGVAVILLVIGLLFLGESEEERFENRMLSLAYDQHSAASGSYQSTAQLYLLGGTSRGSVDRAEARAKEASEEIVKQKRRLSEMASGRLFKMFLFLAGAAIFFIGGVIQSSQSRTQPLHSDAR
jgi:hypothetical protein